MGFRRPEWLNRERLAFLLVALWLAVVTVGLFEPRTERDEIGPQTVREPPPESVRVDVAQFARPDRLDLTGKDPFNLPAVKKPPPPWEPDEKTGNVPIKPDKLPPKPLEKIEEPPVPFKGPGERGPGIYEEEPYVLPVDWVGWVMEAGERIAVLRERETGALLRVREGGRLDAFDLTVVSVRAEGVVLRNAFGANYRPVRMDALPPE